MSKKLNCLQVAEGLVELEDIRQEFLKRIHEISVEYNDNAEEIYDRVVRSIELQRTVLFQDGSLDWFVNQFMPIGINTLEAAEQALKEIKEMEKESEKHQCNQNCENCNCHEEKKEAYSEKIVETGKEIMSLILETNKTLLKLSIEYDVGFQTLVDIFTMTHKRMTNDGVFFKEQLSEKDLYFFKEDTKEKDDVKQSDQEQN